MEIKCSGDKSCCPVGEFNGAPNTENQRCQRSKLNNKTFSKALDSSQYQDNSENNVDVIHRNRDWQCENCGKNKKNQVAWENIGKQHVKMSFILHQEKTLPLCFKEVSREYLQGAGEIEFQYQMLSLNKPQIF